MKTEVCENIPTSSASVTLRSLLKNMNSQMRKIESFSNEKMESLETRIKELKTQNEELENLYYQLLTEEFFLNSPARIEQKAREDLGMVKVRPRKIK